MKRILQVVLLVGAAVWFQGCASEDSGPDATTKLEWGTDLPKAQAAAKAGRKLVLMDFTGSDWCPWCIKLDKEIFAKAAFADYATTNLVLVEVDFPRGKSQSDELKKANEELQGRFKIEGYPTVIVLDSDGKKLGELGYESGGPKPFIARLEALKKG